MPARTAGRVRRKSTELRLIAASAALLVAQMAAAEPPPPFVPRVQPEELPTDPPQPLRLGVLAGSSAIVTIWALQPMTSELARLIERPVEVLPMSSYAAMMDAQVMRRIDGGFFSAAAYAATEAQCSCLEPLVAPTAIDKTVAYHAVIVVRAGSGITSPAGLAGKRVAVGSKDSIGLRRMQLAELMAQGINPSEFGAVYEMDAAVDAVRLLMQGSADAAFAWSSLSGDAAGGYSRGTLAELAAGGEIDMSGLAIIWQSTPITHGPLAVMKSLPDSEKTAIENYFLQLDESNPGVYDALNPFYGGGYVAVEPDDYAGLAVLADQKMDGVELSLAPPPELKPPAAIDDGAELPGLQP